MVADDSAEREEVVADTSNERADAVADDSDEAPEVPEPTPTVAAEPLLTNAGAIVSLTPVEGAGITPLFAWEPAADDATYFLVVKDETGEPYWSWSGVESEIQMHSGGPQIEAGYTWSVSAFDADNNFVAISAELPIAP